MSSTIEDIEWSIRPSQLISIFGPGAIYDNLKDSVLILGIDYWDPNPFKRISDPYLLAQIKKNTRYFDNLKSFAIVSSSTEGSNIPVVSFPSWGVCPECNTIQSRNGHRGSHDFECNSGECNERLQKSGERPPKTVPTRFLAACENGHLDDFPFYEWAHKGKPKENCSKATAQLYLEDREESSSSLDSKFVRCSCGSENDLGMALTETGITYATRKKCEGNNPWLKRRKHGKCGLDLMGMLKGSSNLYFPYNRSAITVPPFSDELSQEILKQWDTLTKFSKKPKEFFEDVVETLFDVKTAERPDGKYTVKQIIEKFNLHIEARTKNTLPDIFELEFAELNSGNSIPDKEFKTEPVEVPQRFAGDLDKLVLVKKLRQMVTITGFTRLRPMDPGVTGITLTPISSEPPEWLPAAENRGEGIFISLKQDELRKWEDNPEIVERARHLLGIAKGDAQLRTSIGKTINARYILLHTLSHLIMRALSDFAGYSATSLQERIYNSDNMAGILIFTSSPSSDGSLGGLVEQGTTDNFYQVLQRALAKSKSCSSDPLCAFSMPEKKQARHGAACHACLFLPETSCESMNEFLDRWMVHSTLAGRLGFFIRE